MEIEKIKQELESQGYVLLDQGPGPFSDEEYFRFINRDNFGLVLVQKESIDDEEFFSTAFGVSDEDVEERLREQLRIPQIMSGRQKALIETKMFDWEDQDFRAVVKGFIEEAGSTTQGGEPNAKGV